MKRDPIDVVLPLFAWLLGVCAASVVLAIAYKSVLVSWRWAVRP